MSIDLTSVLKAKATGLLTDYLQGQLGLSGDTASRSVALAVPALLGKLVSQTDSGDSMTRLFNLVTGPQVDASYDRIEPSLLEKGAKWLSLLFGDNDTAGLARLLGSKTGITSEQGGSLLSAALPLVLGALRSQVETGKMTKPQFVGMLNEQKGFLSRVLDGSLLSSLGLGSLAAAPAAVSQAAVPVQQAASGGGWKKWLWIGALAAVALLLLRMCGQQPNEVPSAAPASATAPAAVSTTEPASEAAAAVLAASEAASAAPAAPASAAALADDAVTWENGVLSVYFATGKTDVNQTAADAVSADIVALGKQGRKLVVSGYNDPRGDAALNAELSKKRAQAVQAYLVAQGVPESAIELRKPVQTDGASGNLAHDRRVDVVAE